MRFMGCRYSYNIGVDGSELQVFQQIDTVTDLLPNRGKVRAMLQGLDYLGAITWVRSRVWLIRAGC